MENWEELNYEEIKLALKDTVFLDFLISKFPDLTRDKLLMKYNINLKCKTCSNIIFINYVLDDLSIINVCPTCKQNNIEKPTDIKVIVNWFNRNYKFAATFDKDENLYCYDKAKGLWSDEKATAVIKKECDVIFKNVPNGISTQKVNNIILSIKAGSYKDHSLFTNAIKKINDKTYINLKNGVLILEENKLTEYSPDYYFRGYVNVKFNKDANVPEKFISFLIDITKPSEENFINLLEAFAYPLMADYPIQKAIALIGAGNNGKSTFLQCMENFYGENYISHLSMQQLSNAVEGQPFALLQILGKIANISDDLPARAVKDVGYFKQLTGGSTIEAERKFGGRVSFVNSAKFFFAANTMPDVSEDSIAFYRRFLFIEFGNKIEKPRNSKELIAELTSEEEKSGLLNILIFIVLKKLSINNDFSFAKSVEDIANQYQKHSNTAKLFCETFLEERNEEATEKQEIEKAYKDFCAQNSLIQVSTKKFWMSFNELFSHLQQSRPQINNERKTIYLGICLTKSENKYSLKNVLHTENDKNSNNILENYLKSANPSGMSGIIANLNEVYSNKYINKYRKMSDIPDITDIPRSSTDETPDIRRRIENFGNNLDNCDTQTQTNKTIITPNQSTPLPNPQTFDLAQLKDLIISYFKKAPEGLILSNSAKKWDFLYGMLKDYDQNAIDQVMRQLIAEEQIIEIKDGVWKRYAYGLS